MSDIVTQFNRAVSSGSATAENLDQGEFARHIDGELFDAIFGEELTENARQVLYAFAHGEDEAFEPSPILSACPWLIDTI